MPLKYMMGSYEWAMYIALCASRPGGKAEDGFEWPCHIVNVLTKFYTNSWIYLVRQ